MKSIRGRLLSRLACGTLVASLSAGGALYWGVHWLLAQQFDTALAEKVANLATLIDQEGLLVEFEFSGELMPEYDRAHGDEYFAIWLADGALLEQSDSLGELELPMPLGEHEDSRAWDLDLPNDRRGRAFAARVQVRDYEPGLEDPGPASAVVVIARSRESLDDALRLLIAGVVGLSALLAGASLWWGQRIVDRGLAPLGTIAAQLEAIVDPGAAPNFALAGTPSEIQPVAAGLNRMLQRIREGFERERRTTANIAHELRTPVAEINLVCELAQRYPEERAEVLQALEQVHGIGIRMQALIATLLQLARAESGALALQTQEFDLGELLRECLTPMERLAEARQLAWNTSLGGHNRVSTDREALRIVLCNLLSNAVEYSPSGGKLEVVLESSASGLRVCISNPAGELRPEDLPHLSEAFWRASDAREDRLHVGLGLTLSNRLCQRLGSSLNFAIEGQTFRARLDIPRQPPVG